VADDVDEDMADDVDEDVADDMANDVTATWHSHGSQVALMWQPVWMMTWPNLYNELAPTAHKISAHHSPYPCNSESI
jgi:hypothetical protein